MSKVLKQIVELVVWGAALLSCVSFDLLFLLTWSILIGMLLGKWIKS